MRPDALMDQVVRASERSRKYRWIFIVLLAFAFPIVLNGCGTVKDCGGVLGNKSDARIRSSQVRMFLKNPSAACARFAPYAAMSALVYDQPKSCRHQLPEVADKEFLVERLTNLDWRLDDNAPGVPECDDTIGTFFKVWKKEYADRIEVVIVFRGTKGGVKDWINGNLRWVTRILPWEDQYERSREYTKVILDYYKNGAWRDGDERPVRFYSAGHSLGGGLAQNVLYRYPNDFIQAYAFDPSPVTGYDDNRLSEKKQSCECLLNELAGEARVYRIYETDEILAWLRFPLKLIVPLSRHIQEVRFNFDVGHSMSALAKEMITVAGESPLPHQDEWWRGREGEEGEDCTDLFRNELEKSCGKSFERSCPN